MAKEKNKRKKDHLKVKPPKQHKGRKERGKQR